MVDFQQVINGIVKYVNKALIPTMNEWQKIAIRVALARVLRSCRELGQTLAQNAFIQTFGIMDKDGHVDLDGLFEDIKAQLTDKPTIDLNIPLYGQIKLNENDILEIYNLIKEG